ncbi:MAG: undecaprenyldiphospho-muramoylpentapeptide beta-N-acetylglucosaminyltransferase [Bdellovibrionales bacterium]
MRSQVVLIAAGGTGGHIYPALAIAHALIAQRPGLRVEFVGTRTGLENQLVPRDGFILHHVPVGKLNRNTRFGERFKTLLLLPWGLLRAAWLVFRMKPVLVLGVGGYVTGPVVLAAALLRRQSFLWEPNAHPGMANRWLAPFVAECLVVFDEAAKGLNSKRIFKVGMPVRAAIEAVGQSPTPTSAAPAALRVLIFGGSQGARAINQVVATTIAHGGAWLENVEFVHQTGPADYERVAALYRESQAKVEVKEYLHDMDRRYAWADVIIARSGTGTVSELAACGKAAVLIPLPTAADNHQQRNAEALLHKEAALMVLQRDFTPDRFEQLIVRFKTDRQIIDRLSVNIRQFHRPHADQEIAQHLLEAVRS